MIGIIVPAHNEEAGIALCLRSLLLAARCPRLDGEDVFLLVVLDACTDATEHIVRRMGVACIRVQARNVGLARARGAQLALAAGARWLAFTDADTVVAPDWVHAHVTQGGDAVCGTVQVEAWGRYGERMQARFDATYTDADGHRHTHGANLSVRAEAYGKAGGFRPLQSGEDVALVDALHRSRAAIRWSAAPRVVTSARHHYRAPGGFGAALARLDSQGSPPGLAGHPCHRGAR